MSLFKRSSRDREKKKSSIGSTISSNHTSFSNGVPTPLNAPNKVVQAIRPYIAQRAGELSFQQGDFFHISFGSELDEIIEIHDPVKGIKGKAPSKSFKFFDKTHKPASEDSSTISSNSSSPKVPQRYPSTSSNTTVGNGNGSKIKVTPLPSLYGRLLYDFKAERPDELNVMAGDSLIICAHHDYEWFIGKFLDKIGEPGLIPVSYVQLYDISTKVPYKESAADIIEKERLPTVDEWKTMKNKHKASARAVGQSAFKQQQSSSSNNNSSDSTRSRSSSLLKSSIPELANPFAIKANVESFSSTNGKYWYLVRVLLSNGTARSLCRYYEDFFNFHKLILALWPREGGQFDVEKRKERIIPYIPGPLVEVTEKLCHMRLNDLDKYLENLLQLPDYISRSKIVNSFFDLLDGDQEFPDQYTIQNSVIYPLREPPIMKLNEQPQPNLQRYNTRNSQYQQDRLSQYDSKNAGNMLSSRMSSFTLQTQQQQQQQQQQPYRVSVASSGSSSAQKPLTNSEESEVKLKLKFYYKDDIFAIVVAENIDLLELKKLIVPRVDEVEDIDILETLKVIPKDVNNVDQYEYIEEDIIETDSDLWSSKNFKDKGKFLVLVA